MNCASIRARRSRRICERVGVRQASPVSYPILEPRHQRIHCQPYAQRQLRRLQPWGVGVVEKFTAISARLESNEQLKKIVATV